MRLTKIVCTLGPSTLSPEVILGLVEGGMNVARLNMAHGDHARHRALIERVRAAAAACGRPVGILADLQGPKIRVGELVEPVELASGGAVVMAPEEETAHNEIPTTYERLAADVRPGDRVLLDDGLLELVVRHVAGRRVSLEVVRGGIVGSHRGINLPETPVQAPALTRKDEADLEFALACRVDLVGLSFVRRPEDVAELKRRLAGRAVAVAKIEKAAAVEAIEGIIAEADAVMVARGDLGVELPFEKVPLAQKRIIRLANLYSRPVITATQMLESMIDHPRPTRAEASDVANAVLDGTDAVMLSGETATGHYPLEALQAMVRIVGEIEEGQHGLDAAAGVRASEKTHRPGATSVEHAIASGTVDAVRLVGAPAVITITRSGGTARLVSSYRPPVPIFAVCTEERIARQLTVVWGVDPVWAAGAEVSYEALLDSGRRRILESGIGRPGQTVVVTAGVPFHMAGTTNLLRIERL
ncbi:MAG: pyruvate kinase [Gemmatimonadetes bacterium]|nr:pyruvate kinase [Gemmatimonadota bacterium]